MDYQSMKIADLKALCKDKGIKGATALKKAELVELLTNFDKANSKKKEEPKKEKNEPKKEKAVKKATPAKTGNNATNKAQVKPLNEAKTAKQKAVKSGNNSPKSDNSNEQKSNNKNNIRNNQNAFSQNKNRRDQRFSNEDQPKNKENKPRTLEQSKPRPNLSQAENKPKTDEEEAKLKKEETLKALDSGEIAEGILEIIPEGFGFIRSENYLPGENDVYVSPSTIRHLNLRTGDKLKGSKKIKSPTEKYCALLRVHEVNGFSPEDARRRIRFEDLTPIFPDERIHLENEYCNKVPMRIMDLLAPVGKGQRGMIVSPPKAGKTTLLKQIAKSVSKMYPDMVLIVLLIDERPEEVTDIKESIDNPDVDVIYSTFDELPEHHKRVSEMVLERAKRLVEHGKDVMILLDSITRLARAYNLTVAPSGRTLSGGLDPAALYMPKKFFGAARNMRNGGSLTVLATALVDTGSRMDDVVFEEFKGTGNMELVLDRSLSERRIFPAIDIEKSGTRRDDLLLNEEEQKVVSGLRREMSKSKKEDNVEEILKAFQRTKDNEQIIEMFRQILKV
ncbi:MAG: transcription termination factor Rho [Lachnospiraceae bacterium]|nr:transcription termination factor Rho [Lachnospiraceae bacterium]